MYPVLMHDNKKCVNCQRCAQQCPNHAITFQPQFHYEKSKCIHCQMCVAECLVNALRFSSQSYSIEQLVKEVMKDWDYYQKSQGGVTISGGEAFAQFDEFLQLIQALKQQHLHVAVETTGHYAKEQLQQALPYIDLFLFDIKSIDVIKFHQHTKGNLKIIQNNFEYLMENASDKVTVRIPVIPNFNEDQLQEILDWLSQYPIKDVHLLPYHTLGKNKWKQIEKDYALKDVEMMNPKTLEPMVLYGQKKGFHIKIGG
ncbi:MAG: glycyl-radical enzyme activating protein, partial [Erysipelotrichaceae bacterium]|nr:glycyl-radical enzyme activating protein [Erysipelotrichaceae bacterium]